MCWCCNALILRLFVLACGLRLSSSPSIPYSECEIRRSWSSGDGLRVRSNPRGLHRLSPWQKPEQEEEHHDSKSHNLWISLFRDLTGSYLNFGLCCGDQVVRISSGGLRLNQMQALNTQHDGKILCSYDPALVKTITIITSQAIIALRHKNAQVHHSFPFRMTENTFESPCG